MKIRAPRAAMGIAAMMLALFGLALILQSQRPAVREAVRVPVFTSVDSVGQPSNWEVSFDWPARVFSGQTESVLVRLAPAQTNGLAGDLPSLHIDEPPPWAVEGRLDLPGVITNPTGLVYAQADSVNGAGLGWQVIPNQAGVYEGTLWVYVNTPAARQAVLARPVVVEVEKIMFFRYHTARWIGGLALAIGIVFGIWQVCSRGRSAQVV